jgi:transposase
MNRIVIGVDISKQKFDASFSLDGKIWFYQFFDNTLTGFQHFIKWLDTHQVSSYLVAMEATGRYGENLAEFLYARQCTVSILNPAQIRYYSKSCLTRSKTDKSDARLIAEFAGKHEIKPWKPLPEEIKKVKALERCLDRFKGDRLQIINRLEQEKDKDIGNLLEERLSLIDQQIQTLKTSLQALAATVKGVEQSLTL